MTRTVPKNEWHPASWQRFPASQQASYPDKAELERVVADLSRLPPITTSWEVDDLKAQIAKAQRGEAFGGGENAGIPVHTAPGGLGADRGVVAEGMVADLVLVDGDPLTDIRATREVRVVVAGGRVFDEAALARLLRPWDARGR